MRKLKLDLDELRVDTFAADERGTEVGTVQGNMPFEMAATDDTSDDGGGGEYASYMCTPDKTCRWTCGFPNCTDFTCLTLNYCCP